VNIAKSLPISIWSWAYCIHSSPPDVYTLRTTLAVFLGGLYLRPSFSIVHYQWVQAPKFQHCCDEGTCDTRFHDDECTRSGCILVSKSNLCSGPVLNIVEDNHWRLYPLISLPPFSRSLHKASWGLCWGLESWIYVLERVRICIRKASVRWSGLSIHSLILRWRTLSSSCGWLLVPRVRRRLWSFLPNRLEEDRRRDKPNYVLMICFSRYSFSATSWEVDCPMVSTDRRKMQFFSYCG
jgi:hypothetical protein